MTALKSTPALKATGIEARCAATGMRMTEQRRVIARVLAEALDHPDVEELYRRCVAVDDKISISTVYRTVKLFEDAGIIERHDFREGRARYEQMRDSHHDHLINLRDGKVIEFTSEEIEKLQARSPASLVIAWSIIGSNSTASRWTTTNPETAAATPFQLNIPVFMKLPRKVHIKSYGCQMNVYDAQRMVDTLAGEGFVETASADDADLVILNTCHIREKASEKVYSELGRLRAVKDEAARNGRTMNIAVAGCVAQAEGEEIIRRAPVVDVVVGPQSYHHLPELLARAKSQGLAIETEFPVEDKFGFLPPPRPEAIRARGISS